MFLRAYKYGDWWVYGGVDRYGRYVALSNRHRRDEGGEEFIRWRGPKPLPVEVAVFFSEATAARVGSAAVREIVSTTAQPEGVQ